MKKLLRNGSAIMLLLSVSVGLSACGSKETSAPPATTQAKTEIIEEISDEEEVYEEETTTEAVETEETTEGITVVEPANIKYIENGVLSEPSYQSEVSDWDWSKVKVYDIRKGVYNLAALCIMPEEWGTEWEQSIENFRVITSDNILTPIYVDVAYTDGFMLIWTNGSVDDFSLDFEGTILRAESEVIDDEILNTALKALSVFKCEAGYQIARQAGETLVSGDNMGWRRNVEPISMLGINSDKLKDENIELLFANGEPLSTVFSGKSVTYGGVSYQEFETRITWEEFYTKAYELGVRRRYTDETGIWEIPIIPSKSSCYKY